MLPVGAFACSNGLESAVQSGAVHDAQTLRAYTRSAVEQAAGTDGVAIVHATRAALAGDFPKLARIDHAVLCRKLNEESRTMSTRMGRKLAELGAAVTGNALLIRWAGAVRSSATPGTYPLSLAVQFVAMGLSTQEKLDAGALDEVQCVHLYGVAMTILNAAMRLMRLSHLDMQAVLYAVAGDFSGLCARAAKTPLDQMACFAPQIDIASANHVRAHVRLFMS